MSNSSLGPGVEFDAIRRMLDTWGANAVGIGDDAAVVHVPRGDALVASVDSAIENRHFKPDWLTAREIGYRSIAAALSDVAAMAAHPIGVLVAIAVPAAWRDRLTEIAAGIGDAVAAAGTRVIGGNLTDATELSITTTAFGAAFAPLTRGGARSGDHVYVTGRLGAPASAIQRLFAGQSPGEFRDRLAHPVPRLLEARWLVDHGASAGIDISDGLVADLRHIAHASGVSLEIDPHDVPCVDGVSSEFALAAGEEYELAVTTPTPFDTAEFERRFRLSLTRIGRVLGDRPGVVDVRGVAVANVVGHDHFSR